MQTQFYTRVHYVVFWFGLLMGFKSLLCFLLLYTVSLFDYKWSSSKHAQESEEFNSRNTRTQYTIQQGVYTKFMCLWLNMPIIVWWWWRWWWWSEQTIKGTQKANLVYCHSHHRLLKWRRNERKGLQMACTHKVLH